MTSSEQRLERIEQLLYAPSRSLTPREREILQLVADGHTNPAIGKLLYLSRETVKSHLRNARKKTGAKNRTHAVVIAFREGLLT